MATVAYALLALAASFVAGAAFGARAGRRAHVHRELTKEAREMLGAMAERGSGGLLGDERE